tara:strand:- start:284 stop:511 length:228 start_codon:yes stop_codon:yes gene_type:complete
LSSPWQARFSIASRRARANISSVSVSERRMKNWMKLAALTLITLTIAACNTVEGIGRDLGEAGDTIEDAARNNRN